MRGGARLRRQATSSTETRDAASTEGALTLPPGTSPSTPTHR